MKLTKRKIQASSDFESFTAFTLDELKEYDIDLYYDFFHNIRNDAVTAYVSKRKDCGFVGVKDDVGKIYVYKKSYGIDGPGWYEVTFDELYNYLS